MASVGWILLGVFILIGIVLCVPVLFAVRYQTGEPVEAVLRWLFFKIDLTGTKTKAAKNRKVEKTKPEKPEKPAKPKAEKKPVEFSEMLGIIMDLLASVKGGAGMLLRRFRIYKIRLRMVVAEEDAAQTAIAYGRANALIYSALAVAQGFLSLAPPVIEIRPDFISETGSVDFEARARLMPIVAVAAAIRIGISFLIKLIRRKSAPEQKKT